MIVYEVQLKLFLVNNSNSICSMSIYVGADNEKIFNEWLEDTNYYGPSEKVIELVDRRIMELENRMSHAFVGYIHENFRNTIDYTFPIEVIGVVEGQEPEILIQEKPK